MRVCSDVICLLVINEGQVPWVKSRHKMFASTGKFFNGYLQATLVTSFNYQIQMRSICRSSTLVLAWILVRFSKTISAISHFNEQVKTSKVPEVEKNTNSDTCAGPCSERKHLLRTDVSNENGHHRHGNREKLYGRSARSFGYILIQIVDLTKFPPSPSCSSGHSVPYVNNVPCCSLRFICGSCKCYSRSSKIWAQ